MIATLPQVRAGKLRIIAITTAQRSHVIREVPTMAESGVPGHEATLWYEFPTARNPWAARPKNSVASSSPKSTGGAKS